MGNYKIISLVQSVLLIITAWSIIDFGHSFSTLGSLTSSGNDLIINKLLFDSPSEFWNVIMFWGYMALIVGILEIVKALSSKE